MRQKVFITRNIPEEGIKLLKEHGLQVDVFPRERPITKEELLEVIEDYNGLLCLLTDTVDKEILQKGRNLKIVSNYAVGYNNIDIETATKLNILVTNTPGILTDATADLTWALILGTARRITEADNYTREKKFNGWSPTLFLGLPVANKTLGIIGAGRIGTAVGLRSIGFSMKVLYTSSHKNSVLENKTYAKKVDLKTLLAESDIISIHVPLTENTLHMIGEEEFEIMKNTAILINTSRGPVVNEKALVKALKSGKIAGAGLDVYEKEPAVEKGLIELPNALLLPHIGSATGETREKMGIMAAKNLLDGLSGKRPEFLVNTDIPNI